MNFLIAVITVLLLTSNLLCAGIKFQITTELLSNDKIRDVDGPTVEMKTGSTIKDLKEALKEKGWNVDIIYPLEE